MLSELLTQPRETIAGLMIPRLRKRSAARAILFKIKAGQLFRDNSFEYLWSYRAAHIDFLETPSSVIHLSTERAFTSPIYFSTFVLPLASDFGPTPAQNKCQHELSLKRSAPINFEFVRQSAVWRRECCFLISAVCCFDLLFQLTLASDPQLETEKSPRTHGENAIRNWLEPFVIRLRPQQKTLSMAERPLIINLCHKNCLEIYFSNMARRERKTSSWSCGDGFYYVTWGTFEFFISAASQWQF